MSSSPHMTEPDTSSHRGGSLKTGEQPYRYRRRELVEPDWRRFPGWTDVTPAQWRDAQWQRVHCIRTIG